MSTMLVVGPDGLASIRLAVEIFKIEIIEYLISGVLASNPNLADNVFFSQACPICYTEVFADALKTKE